MGAKSDDICYPVTKNNKGFSILVKRSRESRWPVSARRNKPYQALGRGYLKSPARLTETSGMVCSKLGFNHCDPLQVVEAAIENIPIKQQIFADLEKACSKDCILSSNTSTIDISLIGKKTKAAERIVGAHFFSPAHIMPLLEIVRTNDTSKQVS